MALEALFGGIGRSKAYSPLGEFLGARFGAPDTGVNTPKSGVSLSRNLALSEPPQAPTNSNVAGYGAATSKPYGTVTAPKMPATQPAGAAPSLPPPVDPSAKPAGAYDPVIAQMDSASSLINSGQNVDYNQLLTELSAAVGAASDTEIANAQQSALKDKRNVLYAYGDKGLASKVLGEGDPGLAAVSADPDTADTTLARIARNYRSTTKGNEDQWNAANLFYSGTRATGLKDLAQQNDATIHDAASQVQSSLDQITNTLAQAEQDPTMKKLGLLQSLFASLKPGTGGGKPTATSAPVLETPQVVSGLSQMLPALQDNQLGGGYKRPGGF